MNKSNKKQTFTKDAPLIIIDIYTGAFVLIKYVVYYPELQQKMEDFPSL